MIRAERLTKDYGTVVAVRGLSFHVGKGEVVGFLGPNGAGKSTTLRMLAGFIGPTEGSVEIGGFDVQADSIEARRQLGYMPETSPLYPEMRVGEYLRFRAEIKKVPRAKRRAAVDRAMELAVVTEMRDTLIQHLSKGYRQRVGLADALVASPPLLILDEPTAGLDPNQIREVRRLIRGLGEEHTILLSTHILSEVESTCSRALVIDRGRLVAEGSIEELRALREADGAMLSLRDPAGVALAALRRRTDIQNLRQEAGAEPALYRVRFEFVKEGGSKGPAERDSKGAKGAHGSGEHADVTLESIISELVQLGVFVREASKNRASLEDVFAQLTQGEAS
ncbi:MAG: ABC transporter ATP-binding protein [Polyangiaceae bacterium]|nr:ABC transporter ATP-binding protein [Polyangiaceae bacterium]MCW5789313.1 ABC transporter ATP-binding protein [Polyangiaceae bacterium]